MVKVVLDKRNVLYVTPKSGMLRKVIKHKLLTENDY